MGERGAAGYATQSLYCFPSPWHEWPLGFQNGMGLLPFLCRLGRGILVVGWPYPIHQSTMATRCALRIPEAPFQEQEVLVCPGDKHLSSCQAVSPRPHLCIPLTL